MILEQFSLQGKTAVVTGCRTGIGQGMAVALAQAGADIVGVGDRGFDDTPRLVQEAGRRFVGLQADLRDPANARKVVEEAVAACGEIHILVNNAGMIRRGESLTYTEQDWDDVMNLDLKTLFFLSQAAAKQFVRQGGGGKIISVASVLSFQGGILTPAYTSAKSAVKGLTMTLANEWAKYGIQVNAIAPGYIATDLTEQLRQDETRSRDILARIPAGRWGTPQDLMGPVVFLASPASDYMTGFTLAGPLKGAHYDKRAGEGTDARPADRGAAPGRGETGRGGLPPAV